MIGVGKGDSTLGIWISTTRACLYLGRISWSFHFAFPELYNAAAAFLFGGLDDMDNEHISK